MEKYATYKVYKNKQTGELKRCLLTDELIKEAEMSDWIELDFDPDLSTDKSEVKDEVTRTRN